MIGEFGDARLYGALRRCCFFVAIESPNILGKYLTPTDLNLMQSIVGMKRGLRGRLSVTILRGDLVCINATDDGIFY